MRDEIEIVGACTNNLRSVDVAFPLRQVTMVVGVSGSGKSSLLADTLATEANARMHRFLGVRQPHLEDQDVPAFIGPLPACLHFSQGAFRASRRTTVATSSGLLAVLRGYFRRYSRPWAEEVEKYVPLPSPVSYGSWIQNHYNGALSVWTVLARWERTNGMRAAEVMRRHGLKRAIVRSETDVASRRETGREVDLEHFRPLSESVKHLIEAEIGRARVPNAGELRALLELAFEIGGDVIVEFQQGTSLPGELHDDRGVLLDSAQHWVHPDVRLPFYPPGDALLSFNSPSNPRSGACAACQGLGRVCTVDVDLLVTNPKRSLHDGALSLWTEKNYRYVNIQHETIEGLRGLRGFSPDVPWKRLSEDARRLVLHGSAGEAIPDIDRRTRRKLSSPRPFPGFVSAILRRAEGAGASARALAALATDGPCTECNGTRWSRQARALRLGRWNLPSLLGLTFHELAPLAEPAGQLERGLPEEALSLRPTLQVAAEAFISAGLGHLSGDRGMTTLSDGESRRSRLAAILRAQGQGLALLLDEPARGLHEEDVARLASALADLKTRHTLILNEHRLSLASVADHVLELGPGAGQHGGFVVKSGSPQRVLTSESYPHIERTRVAVTKQDPSLTITGARLHTLSNVTCRIPLGRFVCVTGVSGSGKSTFIRGILVPALAEALPGQVESEGFAWPDGNWERIRGVESIRTVLALEPRAPTTQRRSTVATLLGLADDLRAIFAKSAEARNVGLTATDFGWNAGHGRCQTCLGLGEVEDGEKWVSCPHCGGRRFGEEALSVRVEGLSIADLLELPIARLLDHPLSATTGWKSLLEHLAALDLGYLTLGRRVDRLSGGEHQRLRVARVLGKEHLDGLFLVLDEPSAGLHPRDVARLLRVLDRVLSQGQNTIVLVEHNLDLVQASDWVVDFGPGGGPAGGRIVGEGPPEKIAQRDTPTGRALSHKKTQPISASHRGHIPSAISRAVDSETKARSGRQWLKRLLGEEVTAEDPDPVDFEGLAVMFDPAAAAARPYEIGGLDVELARLLLDEADDVVKESDHLAQCWSERPEAELRINPLIEEIRVWGRMLPASVFEAFRRRLQHMGLKTNVVPSNNQNLGKVRATGKRFKPSVDTLDERRRCVQDAVGIGGGYVELWEKAHGVLMSIKKRHLDLDVPAVAPLAANSTNLCRSHVAGRCPSCAGNGVVPVFDEALVVARTKEDPTSESLFRPEALNVLRGVRRSVLLPFLKRMTSEGLWPSGRSYGQLKLDERTILLHGYWQRPGPGSFLKTPQSDPEDVSSWLRWNGLFRVVLEEVDRSDASQWVAQIRATTRQIDCPLCSATGLQLYTGAIHFGPRSFFDWIRDGSVGELVKALARLEPKCTRSQKMKNRLLHCLDPLNDAVPRAPLRKAIGDAKLAHAVFERVVHSLTRLELIG